MPILYDNICHGLSDIAAKAFLWAADGPDTSDKKYPAEDFAREIEHLASDEGPLLKAMALSQRQHSASDEVMDDLKRFIVKRAANMRFGGNCKMWWEA